MIEKSGKKNIIKFYRIHTIEKCSFPLLFVLSCLKISIPNSKIILHSLNLDFCFIICFFQHEIKLGLVYTIILTVCSQDVWNHCVLFWINSINKDESQRKRNNKGYKDITFGWHPPLFMIGWDHWIKESVNYFGCTECKGVW